VDPDETGKDTRTFVYYETGDLFQVEVETVLVVPLGTVIAHDGCTEVHVMELVNAGMLGMPKPWCS